MAFVLNIQETTFELEANANRFFQMNVTTPPVITFLQAHEIIMALVDDALNERMAWTDGVASTHWDALLRVFPWLDMPVNEDLADHFYSEVFDDVLTRTTGMIDELIPYGTWDVWDLAKHGKDAILTQGRDYRVMEWERITEYRKPKTRSRLMVPSSISEQPLSAPKTIKQRVVPNNDTTRGTEKYNLFDDVKALHGENIFI